MLTGNLESFGLIDVLSLIKKDKKSCILTVELSTPKNAYMVTYFKDGDPLLSRFLKKSFMVYLDMNFDSILRKEGINKDDLLKNLVEKIPTLLSLKRGRFSITSGFIRFPENIKPEIGTEKLIMALSRTLSQEEVDRKITDEKMVFEKTENWQILSQKASLTDWEKRVLSMVDGAETVSEIESKIVLDEILRRGTPPSEEEIKDMKLRFRRVIYGLLNAGIVRQKIKMRKSENVFDRIINLLDLRYQKS